MRKILVVFTILALTGCHLFDTTSGGGTTTKPPKGGPEGTSPTEPGGVVPPPVKKVNWSASLEKAVEKILQNKVVNQSDSLLIDTIKNNSNVDLNVTALTTELKQLLQSTQRVNLVPDNTLQSARQELGLQDDDSLSSRSKTIGLARHVKAPYILFTSVKGKDLALSVVPEIMQVQTGELIWSETSAVTVDQ